MASSPNKTLSKNASSNHLPTSMVPSSPQSTRTLRRFQSAQNLSSNPPSLIAQQRQLQQNQPQNRGGSGQGKEPVPPLPQTHQMAPPVFSSELPSRLRANSDLAPQHPPGGLPGHRRPAPSRKGISADTAGKRSSLEILLRDGPSSSNTEESLHELRYLILSSRVDADSDGMSPYRIYLWLTLLDIPPFPTDDYLALIHRGRSPAYAKIRNDTFRTLATDPLFKRRVTEASLIRLLNAVAWMFHDANQNSPRLPSSSQASASHNLQLEYGDPSPTKSVTSPVNFPAANAENSSSGVEPAIYVQGMNVLCAPFLYAARSEVEAFALFHHFMTRECPGYLRGAMEGVHKGLALVDQCLSIVEPKLANYLLSKGMHAELYAFPSVLTFCACTPPLPEVLHLWDFLFSYGPHLNILCIVAQLIRMRDTILGSSRLIQFIHDASPTKILRSFPPLDAKEIIALTVLIVRKIPDTIYSALLTHAR